MSKRIAWCLENGRTLVACLDDDEDALLGFINASADKRTVHYVAVRKDFRGNGIAKALMAHMPGAERYSHRPYRVPRFLSKLKCCPFVFGPEAFT
jgi:GNAT superfamily N-acetyltransferase